MRTSSDCHTLVAKYEGFSAKAYKCPAGIWTIGYGHTGDVKPGDTVTEEEALTLLSCDLLTAAKEVDALGVLLRQCQYDALVSLIYNIGRGNFRDSTIRKKIIANPNDLSIAPEFLRWVKAGGRQLIGLLRRRTEEMTLYFRDL